MSRFTFTGSPACGRWPDPARVTSHPPVASARAAPWAWGRMASESPWITSTGQRTRAQPSRKLSSPHTALFTEENNRLLERQTAMYAEDRPLWRRYEQACDFLGPEGLLLLGFERPVMPIRSALRRIGVVIREREEAAEAAEGSVVAG